MIIVYITFTVAMHGHLTSLLNTKEIARRFILLDASGAQGAAAHCRLPPQRPAHALLPMLQM